MCVIPPFAVHHAADGAGGDAISYSHLSGLTRPQKLTTTIPV
jgi:hypothetical protein